MVAPPTDWRSHDSARYVLPILDDSQLVVSPYEHELLRCSGAYPAQFSTHPRFLRTGLDTEPELPSTSLI